MVGGEGFEPSKSKTADLQSAPFGHSGIHPLTVAALRSASSAEIRGGRRDCKLEFRLLSCTCSLWSAV